MVKSGKKHNLIEAELMRKNNARFMEHVTTDGGQTRKQNTYNHMVNMSRHDDTQVSLSETKMHVLDTKSAVNALGEQQREWMARIEEQRRLERQQIKEQRRLEHQQIELLTSALEASMKKNDSASGILASTNANDHCFHKVSDVESPRVPKDESSVISAITVDASSAAKSAITFNAPSEASSRPNTAQSRKSKRIQKKDEVRLELEKENLRLQLENKDLNEREAARTRPPKDPSAVAPRKTPLRPKTKDSVIEHQDRQALGRRKADMVRACRLH
jgi:hypothetical protein